MILSTTGKGNTVAETFDDAVELGRVAFRQPFDGAYEVTGRGRRVKTVLDDCRVHRCRFKAADRGAWKLTCREEFENVNRRLCTENALKWGQCPIALRVIR